MNLAFNKLTLATAVIISVGGSTAMQSSASIIERISFSRLSKDADVIVEAHVQPEGRRTEVRNGLPYTCITLSVSRNLKGNAGSELSPCFLGGPIGDEVVSVSGLRLPEEGKSGFFFFYGVEKNYNNPLVGWDQGVFYIDKSSDGSEFITTSDGQIVEAVRFSEVPAVVETSPNAAIGVEVPKPGEDPRARISPSAFIDIIHQSMIASP